MSVRNPFVLTQAYTKLLQAEDSMAAVSYGALISMQGV